MLQNKNGLIIIGAGGHAKVVLSIALADSQIVLGYLDDTPALLNQIVTGYPVIGPSSTPLSDSNTAIIAIGDNQARQTIAQRQHHFPHWKALIHPRAYVHSSAKIGRGTVICAGAIIQPDVIIGDHCIINTGATIDHDTVIENYVHIAPGAHIGGQVKIGLGSFLGIGSSIIPDVELGAWVQVAAGGVVVNSVAAGKRVMGVPARSN